MGLIREVQGVSASLNKQERARRERERLKILQENYKKELESDLKSEFLNIYNKTDIETAYKIIVLEKGAIIEKIYNIISKITYEQDGKRYYTYFNFDIIGDLQESYFKILAKVKNEVQLSEKIRESELYDALEWKLIQLFELSYNKYCASIIAKKNDMKIKIINDITQNERDRSILKDNYGRILEKVIKQYEGDIITEKMEIKHKKEKSKVKQNRKIFNQLILGYILGGIAKSLPKGFSKGKGR